MRGLTDEELQRMCSDAESLMWARLGAIEKSMSSFLLSMMGATELACFADQIQKSVVSFPRRAPDQPTWTATKHELGRTLKSDWLHIGGGGWLPPCPAAGSSSRFRSGSGSSCTPTSTDGSTTFVPWNFIELLRSRGSASEGCSYCSWPECPVTVQLVPVL